MVDRINDDTWGRLFGRVDIETDTTSSGIRQWLKKGKELDLGKRDRLADELAKPYDLIRELEDKISEAETTRELDTLKGKTKEVRRQAKEKVQTTLEPIFERRQREIIEEARQREKERIEQIRSESAQRLGGIKSGEVRRAKRGFRELFE